MSEYTPVVLAEIADERQRQQEVHGWDENRDALHGVEDWAWLIARRAVEMCNRSAAPMVDSRRLFVEIAAIAVAAIEADDRRAQITDVRLHPARATDHPRAANGG